MRKRLYILILCVIMLMLTVPVSAGTRINKKKATLYIGNTVQLKILGTNEKAKWKSSNKKVATVSSKGKVKAKRTGKATITATVGKKKYTCKITVKQKTSPVKTPASFTLVDFANSDRGYCVVFDVVDQNKSSISSASGSVTVRIVNDTGVVVYDGTINYSPSDYLQSVNGRYYYYAYTQGIGSGISRNGTVEVTCRADGVLFNTVSLKVSNLPMLPLNEIVKIEFPTMPALATEYWGSSPRQSVNITSMRYVVNERNDGTYNVIVYASGEKIADILGEKNTKSVRISTQLYQGDIVVGSAGVNTPKVHVGQKFQDADGYYNGLKPGTYKLSVES